MKHLKSVSVPQRAESDKDHIACSGWVCLFTPAGKHAVGFKE